MRRHNIIGKNYNKMKFISAFQNGFYSMCMRERPENSVSFITDVLTDLFYCTNNIGKMNVQVDNRYIESIENSKLENSSIVKVFDFNKQRKFVYALKNHSKFDDYDEGVAGTYNISCRRTDKDIYEYMHKEYSHKRINIDDIFVKENHIWRSALYVTISGRNYGTVYFPIDVTEYQASMNLYQFSKMISFAVMFTFDILDIYLGISSMGHLSDALLYYSVFKMPFVHECNTEALEGFLSMLHSNNKCVDNLIKKSLPEHCKDISLYGSSDASVDKDEDLDTLRFSTVDQEDNKEEEDEDFSINIKRKNGENNITAVGVMDSESVSILDIIKAINATVDKIIDNKNQEKETNDKEEDEEISDGKDDKNSSFETIIKFIEFLDIKTEGILDVPPSTARCVIKAIRKYLKTPRHLREIKAGAAAAQAAYSQEDINMIFKISKSNTDRTMFIASNTGKEFELQKVLVPLQMIGQDNSAGIGIALNGVGVYIPIKDTVMDKILLGIEDKEDFCDDCLRIIMAWLGSHSVKYNNTINPYANDKNNIVLTDTTFSSIVNAFESVDCFNSEKEIDALIDFVSGNKTNFICPWMKGIKSVESYPIVVDKDGQYYGYDKSGYRFTKLMSTAKKPSSPFFTDLSWQIIKGGNSITLKGQYLSTDAFEKDIVSVLNYLKILKKDQEIKS